MALPQAQTLWQTGSSATNGWGQLHVRIFQPHLASNQPLQTRGTQLKQIRDQQKETRNKFLSGWRKWDAFSMKFLQPMGNEIIRCSHVKDTDVVLDVAVDTGEPELTIASMVARGRVAIIDLAKGMLDVTRGNAAQGDITNYETVACDVYDGTVVICGEKSRTT